MRKAEFSIKAITSDKQASITTSLPDECTVDSACSVGRRIKDLLAKEWDENPNLVELRVQLFEVQKL